MEVKSALVREVHVAELLRSLHPCLLGHLYTGLLRNPQERGGKRLVSSEWVTLST